jgi:hypothetical protein
LRFLFFQNKFGFAVKRKLCAMNNQRNAFGKKIYKQGTKTKNFGLHSKTPWVF